MVTMTWRNETSQRSVVSDVCVCVCVFNHRLTSQDVFVFGCRRLPVSASHVTRYMTVYCTDGWPALYLNNDNHTLDKRSIEPARVSYVSWPTSINALHDMDNTPAHRGVARMSDAAQISIRDTQLKTQGDTHHWLQPTLTKAFCRRLWQRVKNKET